MSACFFLSAGFAVSRWEESTGLAESSSESWLLRKRIEARDSDSGSRRRDSRWRSNGSNSPILEVTEGYIRIHQLQGNSNDGDGGGRDPNGGDAVILEIWKIPDEVVGATLKPGDVNGDAGFNIADPVAHLNSLFSGGALPECYVVPGSDPVELTQSGLAILDFNGDGGSNIADSVAALNFLFGGGSPPALGEDCTLVEGECTADNCN